MSNLSDRLDNYAEPWKPNPGDKLIGTVTALDERDGGYGTYPIVTVASEDGTEWAVHAFHAVLKSELAKQRPQVGERIGIAYLKKPGTDGKAYHSYRVIVERDEQAMVDWDRIEAEAAAEAGEPEPEEEAEKPPPANDDIPF